MRRNKTEHIIEGLEYQVDRDLIEFHQDEDSHICRIAAIHMRELRNCVNLADIFFKDITLRFGALCIQNYAALNELGIALEKLADSSEVKQ